MADKPTPRPTDAELAILSVLWERGPCTVREVHDTLSATHDSGYTTVDLTGNETAKLHVRHMVGGRSLEVVDERLCRFEFPERPGALMAFLEKLGGRWNISLFHYRNHGADFGRVLAGFEVPAADTPDFDRFLDTLGYRYQRESSNIAYDLFLGRP